MARKYFLGIFVALLLVARPCCSERTKRRREWTERVVQGKEAPIGRFPYVCSLRKRGSRDHKCGGTLIRDRWLVTAAHCIDPEFPNSVGLNALVYCGIHHVNTRDPDLTFNSVEGYLHDSWTGDTDDGYDIGLLKLDRSVNTTLPHIDSHGTPINSGEVLTALGWGKTEWQDVADTLQMAENLHYVVPARCKMELRRVYEEHMICAGLLNEDTCKGDSGGPLLIPDKPDGNITAGVPEADLLVGLTSFGSRACDASTPGVYTRISYLWSWISSIVDGIPVTTEDGGTSTSTSTEDASTADPPDTQFDNILASLTAPASEEALASSPQNEDNPALIKMIEALETDDASAVEDILLQGLDPESRHNDTDYEGGDSDDILLHWCARFDSPKSAQVLIDFGADIEATSREGNTPLQHSARFNTADTAKVLLKNDANVDARSGSDFTALISAALYGSTAATKVLLRNGAFVNAKGFFGMTALHTAALANHVNIAKALLRFGASVKLVDDTGFTALHYAAYRPSPKIIEILLEAGASKTVEDDDGNMPRDVLCIRSSCYGPEREELEELLTP